MSKVWVRTPNLNADQAVLIQLADTVDVATVSDVIQASCAVLDFGTAKASQLQCRLPDLSAQAGPSNPLSNLSVLRVALQGRKDGDEATFIVEFRPSMLVADHTDRKRPRSAWKFEAIVSKGASFQHLRQRVFEMAEISTAFDGNIAYSTPVSADSDLCIELYFKGETDARTMETTLVRALRESWRSDTIPLINILEIERELQRRVWKQDYDRSTSPDRVSWDIYEEAGRSAATTVLDAEEIALESVVDDKMTDLRFERCHINASIKGTHADSEGNWIPLPVDWHKFFDAYTIDNKALVSIVGHSKIPDEKIGDREGVVVHVYFAPHLRSSAFYSGQLRNATMVRKGVFAVTVWKREADKFIAQLQTRHDRVTQSWSSVP